MSFERILGWILYLVSFGFVLGLSGAPFFSGQWSGIVAALFVMQVGLLFMAET